MKEKKEKFNTWRWECIDAEVECNLPSKLVIYFTGPVWIKKNSRQNFWHFSLPSQNYIEWHKRVINKLNNIERMYNSFPCKVAITTIAWERRKSDCDNLSQWILDTFTDLGIIEDDNKFVIPELHVRNVGYAKNCWLTKVELSPYISNNYDIIDDHKEKNLLDYKYYLDDCALRS